MAYSERKSMCVCEGGGGYVMIAVYCKFDASSTN